MQIKTLSTIKNKQEAREIAIKWQKWPSNENMSYGEILKWYQFFRTLAIRFGLKKEFKENGIL